MVEEMQRYVRSGQRCLWTVIVKWANTAHKRQEKMMSSILPLRDPDEFTRQKE